MIKAFLNKLKKTWVYLPLLFKKPLDIPFVVWQVFTKRIHAATLLKLNCHKVWLKNAAIRTVIDAGANEGQFAFAIKAILPKTQLYLFEPLSDCCKKLLKKTEKYKDCHVFRTALGETKKETIFWKNDFSPSSSVLPMLDLHKKIFPKTTKKYAVNVELNTLDSYFEAIRLIPKALLKIDVQGYEDRVLSGSNRILQYVDYVLVEVSFKPLYERQASFQDINNFLVGQGFEHSANLEELFSPQDNTLLQTNALFIKKHREKTKIK